MENSNKKTERIDFQLTNKILERINNNSSHKSEIKVTEIPSFDNKSILNLTDKDFSIELNYKTAKTNLKYFTDMVNLADFSIRTNDKIILNREELEKIGLHLLPLVSVGILNGGAATSYTDRIKNSEFNISLYNSCRNQFDLLRDLYKNSPKGITPAYINNDNTYGASFIELKMRSFLLQIDKYKNMVADTDFRYPIFQMTSIQTDQPLYDEYIKYKDSIYLKNLMEKTNTDITSVLTEVQPLLAAFTPSEEGKKRKIFKDENNEMLLLPGGHGQNFSVLKNIYRKLLENGKRFVYLGNVDNIGFNIDFTEVALLALTGCEAGFDFSIKTPVDVKGGILTSDESGKLNCGDIGAAVSRNDVEEAEKQGKSILFNCATGLFNLEYLVENIDLIIDNLPLRVTEQKKESGCYSHAEQNTWEIISLLDNFLIFGVNKYSRFLASKMLIENMMISRPECCCKYFTEHPESSLISVSDNMNRGLTAILSKEMNMINKNNRWIPL